MQYYLPCFRIASSPSSLPWTRFHPCWLAECDPSVLNADSENIQTSRGHITIDIEGRKHGEDTVLSD